MAVGAHEIEGGLGNLGARQFRVVHGVGGEHVEAQQVAEALRSLRRRGLPDHEQVEPDIVERLERDAADRAVRAELEPQPREAVAGAQRAGGQSAEGLRQSTLAVVDADLRDDANAVMNDIVAMPTDYPRYKCVMPGWDNTPRRGAAGNVFHGATPQLYELWLREAIGSSRRRFPIGQRMIFINAWNEWGEGAHIEPDIRFGRQYLEATRRAIIGLSDWRTIMAGAKSRLPAAAEDLAALESWLESFQTSLQYLSNQYLSLENQRLGWQPSFVHFADSQLASLDLKLNGSCNIERINQFVGGNMIDVDPGGYLHVDGWSLLHGNDVTADTDSYLTLIPADHDETYTARMLRRIPRTDVAEYHKLPEDKGLWSGIRARANLHRVRPGKYEIGIDTRIGSACFRTLSKTVIVVGRP